jgi:predicted aspartyl protease
MIRKSIYLILLLLSANRMVAQYYGTSLPAENKVDIPFEFQGKFIVINVTFERLFPLRLIFDTGAEHTILTQRKIADMILAPYDRQISIMGADMLTELYADIARRVRLDLPGVEMQQDILVLGEDYFHLDEIMGEHIHGILGASVFRNYVVKINYNQQVITLYDPATFKVPTRKYTRHEIQLDHNKPYINSRIQLSGDTSVQTRLLMDTGAGLSLLIYSNSYTGLVLPEHILKANIGMGLGGYLEGYVGRVSEFEFCGYPFRHLITNFQDISDIPDSTSYAGKQGIIGNDLLSRFNLILDFPGEVLYVKPNRHFKTNYNYDRSGISLIAAGTNLNKMIVSYVLENSPGDETGILEGDEIISINGNPTAILRLNGCLDKLQGKPGKKMRLRIKRNGEKLVKVLVLRELI